jgi:hypothetical protein
VGEVSLPEWLAAVTAPVVAVMEKLNDQIPRCGRPDRQAGEAG